MSLTAIPHDGPRCDPFGAQPLRVFVPASHRYRKECNMTQQEFDRRFYQVFKVGFGTLLLGIALAIIVGLPALALFDRAEPFFAATAVVILGGCICVSTFAHDIFCNPRWKR